MIIIQHRRNTIDELIATSVEYGVEVDIRSYGDELIMHHDPFSPGTSFSDWLRYFRHKTLILNVKEEGLEARVLDLMRRNNIEDFFFLDQSFPFLLKTAKSGEKRCAIRISEYESLHTALAVAKLIDWCWVDYFSAFPLTGSEVQRLTEAGLKLCLVSPELQGYDPDIKIPEIKKLLSDENIELAAVCTKKPDLWL